MPGVDRFELADTDGRLRQATRGLTFLVVAGSTGLLVAALVVVVIGYLAGQWLLLGIGALFATLAVFLVVATARSVTARYRSLEVDDRGVTLRMADDRAWRARWDDPTLRFLLFDHTLATGAKHRRFREVPCQLFSIQFHVGIPRDACNALRERAAQARVALRDETDPEGVRTTIVGSGPEAGTPFQKL